MNWSGSSVRLGILRRNLRPGAQRASWTIAQEAAARLALDEVVFMPTGRPWMKEGNPITDAERRVAMLRLAVEGNPAFGVSTLEADRPGLSYTVDTLTALLGGEAGGASLFFILGMDSLETLHRWKEPSRLFDMCTLVAVSQAGPRGLRQGDAGRHTARGVVGGCLSGGAGHRHKRSRDTASGWPGPAHRRLGSPGGREVHPRTRTLSGGWQ